jgi:nucleotide-binding universal stress UspA family protein
VLLALAAAPSSAGVIRAAEQLVLSDATTATVVHAYDPPYQGMLNYANVSGQNVADYIQGWRGEAATSIRDFVHCESADPSRFSLHVEPGHTVHGILRAVHRFNPDLLIMGTRGGGRMHRALLGSVANRVVHHAPCDVMVVPAGRFHALAAQPDAPIDLDLPGAILPIRWTGQARV